MTGKDGNTITASARGDVRLVFGVSGLEWVPRFLNLQISTRNLALENNNDPEALADLTAQTLENLNTDIFTAMTKQDRTIPISATPVGEIQVGAHIPELSQSPALFSQMLTGTSRVVSSAMLIESSVTTIALDIEFTPGQSACPQGTECPSPEQPTFQAKTGLIDAQATTAQARQSFTALHDGFKLRTANFFITPEKPEIALIEVNRKFLISVLQISLEDLKIDAEFNSADLSIPQFSADLQSFNPEHVVCKKHQCSSKPVCTANFAQCKRFRDTRDCTSCVFRNPLNNRCIREEVDPACAAARDSQNARYDTERARCIESAENLKLDCEKSDIRTQRACQQTRQQDYANCKTIKTKLENVTPGTPFANIKAQSRASGKLLANFSNFRINGNLNRLKLDIQLASSLQLEGNLSFAPYDRAHPLADCLMKWSTPFSSRFLTAPTVSNLLSSFDFNRSTLKADWSGFGITLQTHPSPLESISERNPKFLTNCDIEIDLQMIERSLMGANADFFRGHLTLEIQPLPTTIRMTPAVIKLGDSVYSARARLSNRNLRYEINKNNRLP